MKIKIFPFLLIVLSFFGTNKVLSQIPCDPSAGKAPSCYDNVTCAWDHPKTVEFDQFMGINLRRADPIGMATCVTQVREYHTWDVDEVIGSTYPNNRYNFKPTNPGRSIITDFDLFYQTLNNLGLNVCATLTEGSIGVNKITGTKPNPAWPSPDPNVPQFINKGLSGDPNNCDVWSLAEPPSYTLDPNSTCLGPIPICDEINDFETYRWRGDYVTQFVNRYGGGITSTNEIPANLNKNIPIQHAPNGTSRGLITYLENWNEQDAWWHHGGQLGGSPIFSEEEYSIMTSVDFYGKIDASSLIDPLEADFDCNGLPNTSYPLGIDKLESNLQFVMGGLSAFDECYLKGIVKWFGQANTPDFPFDVLNFHHYSDEGYGTLNLGASPERDNLQEQLKRLDLIRDEYFDGKELWLSEFGYNTMRHSGSAPFNGDPGVSKANAYLAYIPASNYQGNTHLDIYEIQGQWIVRSFLAAAAADIDKAFVFEIRDGTDNPIGQWDLKCGLLESGHTGFKPKKSWFYTYSVKNILAGYDFEGQIQAGSLTCSKKSPRAYRFTNASNEQIIALWSPTECGNEYFFDVSNLNLGNVAVDYYYRLEVPSTTGILEGDGITKFTTVPVSERPIFLVLGTPAAPVECVQDVKVENITCTSVNLSWDIPATHQNAPNKYDHYQIWYGPVDGIDPSRASAPDIFLDDITLFEEELDGSFTQAFVGGLEPNKHYYFYIIPHVFDPLTGKSNSTDWCSDPIIEAMTKNQGGCDIRIKSDWITVYTDPALQNLWDPSQPLNMPVGISFAKKLFDGHLNKDAEVDCCNFPDGVMEDFDYLWSNKGEYIHVDLKKPHDINVMYLYDGEGIGSITVEYFDGPLGMGPNDPGAIDYWKPFIDGHITNEYLLWKVFANDVPACQPIQHLRIYGGALEDKFPELVLCGKEMDTYNINGNVAITDDGCGKFTFKSHSSVQNMDHEWDFDYGGIPPTFNVESTDPNPTHSYPNGTFTVRHKISNLCNEIETDYPVNVSVAAINSNVTYDEVPCGTFTFTENDPVAQNMDHEWDFDYDGVTFDVESILLNPTHPYLNDGSYTVGHRITNNCGSITESIPITVDCTIPRTCFCGDDGYDIGTPDETMNLSDFFPTISNGGTVFLNNNCISVEGTLIIDRKFSLLNCTVEMGPGAELIVPNEIIMTIAEGTQIFGCEKMWKGITVEGGGHFRSFPFVNSDQRCSIEDALYGLELKDKSIISLRNTDFRQNYVGIHISAKEGSFIPTYSAPIIQTFENNLFSGAHFLSTNLKPAYDNQPYHDQYSFAGIWMQWAIFKIGLEGEGEIKNFFEQSSYGIYSSFSSVEINDAEFRNIAGGTFPNVLNPKRVNGVGIYYENGLKLDVSESSFNKMGTGVYNEGLFSTIDISDENEMNEISLIGIDCQDPLLTEIKINNNTRINGINSGIVINNASGANKIRIKENFDIELSDNNSFGGASQGGIRINGSSPNGTLTDALLYNNSVFTESSNGIVLNFAGEAKVKENTVDFSVQKSASGRSAHGIFLGNSFPNAQLKSNDIKGIASYKENYFGIKITRSPNYFACCNFVDLVHTGVRFSGGNNGRFRYNRMNDHQFGLVIENFSDCGVQVVAQNQWHTNKCCGTIGAEHRATAVSFIEDSEFRVIQGTSFPFIPQSFDPPALFVEIPEGNEKNCYNDPLCPEISIDGISAEISLGISELNIKTAIGERFNEPGLEAWKWQSEKYLYEILKKEPELLSEDNSLEVFYNNISGSSVQEFVDLKLQIQNDLFFKDDPIHLEIENLKHLAFNLLEEINSIDILLQDANSQDSVSLTLAKIEHLAEVKSTLGNFNEKIEIVKTGISHQASILRSINSNIETQTIFELNEKNVNDIWLYSMENLDIDFTVEQLTSLSDIASQCPVTGGMAVYLARAILEPYNNEDYNDDELCQPNQGRIKSNFDSGKSQLNIFSVSPNPVEDKIFVTIGIHEKEAELSLVNSVGIETRSVKVAKDEFSKNIDTDNLPSGLYFIRLKEGDNVLHTKKIIIQK